MSWKNTDELLKSIHDATDRLTGGETDVETAHAEARLLGVATKVIQIRLDHAKVTGRLSQGSDSLPDLKIGQ